MSTCPADPGSPACRSLARVRCSEPELILLGQAIYSDIRRLGRLRCEVQHGVDGMLLYLDMRACTTWALRASARVEFLALRSILVDLWLGLSLAPTREAASGAPVKINRTLDLVGGGRLVRCKQRKID
jgi:hypothetical protein